MVSSGFSIELDYDFHVGVFSGQLSPTEIIQTLGRNRKAKEIILGLSPKRQQKALRVTEQLTGIVNAEGRLKEIDGKLVHEELPFDRMAAGVIKNYESSCEQYAHTTLRIFIQKGYQVEALAEPKSLIIIKGTGVEVKAKYAQDVIQAEDLTAEEHSKLKKAATVLESSHHAIEKFECKEQLAVGKNISLLDIGLWNDGKFAPILKRFEVASGGAENARLLDEYERDRRVAPKDRTYATSKQIIFNSVMEILHGETLQTSGALKKSIPLHRYGPKQISAAIDYLHDNYEEVHAAGLGNAKDLNRKLDARTLGYFLKRFGLKHKSAGKNNAGNYQITEESLSEMQNITKRRKSKKISVFKQARAWHSHREQEKQAA